MRAPDRRMDSSSGSVHSRQDCSLHLVGGGSVVGGVETTEFRENVDPNGTASAFTLSTML